MVYSDAFIATKTGVVVVNYCRVQDTLACLQALARLNTPPKRIVVVDNGSDDDSVARLQHALAAPIRGTRPELLVLADNRGFAGGNNAALRFLLQDSGCHSFWLLNNDTKPAPEALDALCARLGQLTQPGACGSLLVHMDEEERVQCLGGGRLQRLIGTTSHLGDGLRREATQGIHIQAVESQLDYICGASLLVTRKSLLDVGFLDESYFLYYEDVDWGVRMRRHGYDLGFANSSVVVHKEGASTGACSARTRGETPQRSTLVDYLSLRNRIWLMRKMFPWSLPLVLVGSLGVLARRYQRGQVDRFPLLLRAIRDGLTGRMGTPVVPKNTP